MGCDIHYVLEKRVGAKWVGILWTDYSDRSLAKQRDYGFFGKLAGVRGEPAGRWPKMIPPDISDLSLYAIAKDGPDGHSHSWLSLREFCQAYVEAQNADAFQERKKVDPDEPWQGLLGLYIDENERGEETPDDYRLIFWFDN